MSTGITRVDLLEILSEVIKQIDHPCQALIDQNRYIGDDCIGHRCYRKATHLNAETGAALCDECEQLLQAHPVGLVVPIYEIGTEWDRLTEGADRRPESEIFKDALNRVVGYAVKVHKFVSDMISRPRTGQRV